MTLLAEVQEALIKSTEMIESVIESHVWEPGKVPKDCPYTQQVAANRKLLAKLPHAYRSAPRATTK